MVLAETLLDLEETCCGGEGLGKSRLGFDFGKGKLGKWS